ncbi:MAG: hypothetical protein R3C28_07120 [Pirellulaceae bacterium]
MLEEQVESYIVADIDNDGIEDLVAAANTESGRKLEVIRGLTRAAESLLSCRLPDGKLLCGRLLFPLSDESVEADENPTYVLSAFGGLGSNYSIFELGKREVDPAVLASRQPYSKKWVSH